MGVASRFGVRSSSNVTTKNQSAIGNIINDPYRFFVGGGNRMGCSDNNNNNKKKKKKKKKKKTKEKMESLFI